MPSYTLSPMFDPQYVPAAVAALVFGTGGNPNAVPSSVSYQIAVARAANVTAAPVNLTMWRVPSGANADEGNIVIPQIAIPPASINFPWIDLLALWGVVLQSGDSIWALASVGNALVIHGDGVIVGQ